MEQLLSVIVTVYNCEQYISKCLDSIVNQTYKALEIIIVDDGSTDNSGEICQKYIDKYSHVHYVKKDNGGTASARKKGIELVKGNYVAFVDGDDYIDKNMYESYISVMEAQKVDVVIGCISKEYQEKSVLVNNRIEEGKYEKGTNYGVLLKNLVDAGPFSDCGIHASLCSKVFKTDEIKPWILKVDENLVYGEDAVALYPCIVSCNSVSVTTLGGYHWVMRDSSKTHKKDEDYLLRLFYLEKAMKGIFEVYCDSEELDYILFRYMLNQIQNALNKEYGFCEQYEIKKKNSEIKEIRHLFPFEKITRKSKIVIYGNGKVGREFYRQIQHSDYCDIIAVADKDTTQKDYVGKPVLAPGDVVKEDFDFVVVAIHDGKIATVIKENLCKCGISGKKIIWQNYLI